MSADSLGREFGTTIMRDVESVIRDCRVWLEELRGKRILVTGASGFVGGAVARVLAAYSEADDGGGFELVLATRSPAEMASRPETDWLSRRARWIGWDTLEADSRLVFDHVIHAASPNATKEFKHEPERCVADVASYMNRVLTVVKRNESGRLLYVSSGAVYGERNPLDGPYREDDEIPDDATVHRGPYGRAKRAVEVACGSAGINYVVARIFAVMGPSVALDSGFALTDFIWQAAFDRRIRIRGDGMTKRGYCYESDLAASLLGLLVEGRSGQAYNVAGPAADTRICELAECVAGEFGDIPVDILGEADSAGTAGRYYVPVVDKLGTIYNPRVGLTQGVAKTIAGMRERGLL